MRVAGSNPVFRSKYKIKHDIHSKLKNIPNIEDVDLESGLGAWDIVCNTCKLTPETRNLIGKRELSLMKRNAILTSTTGGVIDLDALSDFLKKILCLGWDLMMLISRECQVSCLNMTM
ncbi:MAG: hypothetical protein J6K39_03535 [Clostridia bacterium]|nr:hypothetical protein [Clostridia bacterium]